MRYRPNVFYRKARRAVLERNLCYMDEWRRGRELPDKMLGADHQPVLIEQVEVPGGGISRHVCRGTPRLCIEAGLNVLPLPVLPAAGVLRVVQLSLRDRPFELHHSRLCPHYSRHPGTVL